MMLSVMIMRCLHASIASTSRVRNANSHIAHHSMSFTGILPDSSHSADIGRSLTAYSLQPPLVHVQVQASQAVMQQKTSGCSSGPACQCRAPGSYSCQSAQAAAPMVTLSTAPVAVLLCVDLSRPLLLLLYAKHRRPPAQKAHSSSRAQATADQNIDA